MNINELIKETLAPLNVPIFLQFYEGKATPYITFFEYVEQGESFSEDDEETTGHYIQVDIWSKSDCTNIGIQVKALLKNAGFKRTSSTDLYEKDTKIFHKSMKFFYLEEII